MDFKQSDSFLSAHFVIETQNLYLLYNELPLQINES